MIIEEKELKQLLEREYHRGFQRGIRVQEEKMLLACENGTPISINGRAYFIKSDIQNLHNIFADLEADAD